MSVRDLRHTERGASRMQRAESEGMDQVRIMVREFWLFTHGIHQKQIDEKSAELMQEWRCFMNCNVKEPWRIKSLHMAKLVLARRLRKTAQTPRGHNSQSLFPIGVRHCKCGPKAARSLEISKALGKGSGNLLTQSSEASTEPLLQTRVSKSLLQGGKLRKESRNRVSNSCHFPAQPQNKGARSSKRL